MVFRTVAGWGALAIMTAQQPLALVPADALEISEAVALVHDQDGGRVFIRGELVFAWDPGDELGRRLAAVQLVRIKAARAVQVAGGFGVNTETLRRWQGVVTDAGVAALAPSRRGPKGPSRLTHDLVADIAARRRAGASLRTIAKAVGVSAASVRRVVPKAPPGSTRSRWAGCWVWTGPRRSKPSAARSPPWRPPGGPRSCWLRWPHATWPAWTPPTLTWLRCSTSTDTSAPTKEAARSPRPTSPGCGSPPPQPWRRGFPTPPGTRSWSSWPNPGPHWPWNSADCYPTYVRLSVTNAGSWSGSTAAAGPQPCSPTCTRPALTSANCVSSMFSVVPLRQVRTS